VTESVRVGWAGAGRMGFQMVTRLLGAGYEVWVWNRTRAKAEPLAELGATLVDTPADLAACDVVFTMVAGSDDLVDVVTGILSRPVLEALGEGVTYVGEDDAARLVKICHNLMLGVVTQCLAEITVLAERGGVSRADFLAFLNASVMGSTFTRYKTPAFVELDFTPTFTPVLLRKDFDLGLAAGKELGVPLPVAELVRELVQRTIDEGHVDVDFAALLEVQARAAGMELEPEPGPVPDGLEPVTA
jgi:3-hydroxyisobutyrate dehydrogenase